ncbi:MAG: hypothetical protein IJI27_04435 [Oscillospiraceae bacterium]|nr:hypothetical protein [Oscillospiraceae bacterium]
MDEYHHNANQKDQPRAALPGLIENPGIPLELDRKGWPVKTIDNFFTALEWDYEFSKIRYNELAQCAEHFSYDLFQKPTITRWTDKDLAWVEQHLETYYGLYSPTKLQTALRLFYHHRRYHPIQERLRALDWDGTPRIEGFLTRWMGCEDSPYIREVSRLIFAGGVHRLFDPGCKFDYVPVLVGKQGSGKSTIVRWLAVEDDWFTELTTMEGKESIEQLTGAWICEITELLALSRVKEQEAVKSFLSRQRDRYRRPYDREVTEQPRQCVFLGTTNRRQFLRDRTGNRRFCPVEVHTTGAELYAREKECRAEILQCWAEAVDLYEQGKLSAVADAKLLQAFEDVQREAMEEDWRVGAIERYVYRCPEDYFFCVRDVARNGLVLGMDNPRDPTPQESREIALILDSLPILERAGRKYLKSFGRQRVWKRAGLGDGLDADS